MKSNEQPLSQDDIDIEVIKQLGIIEPFAFTSSLFTKATFPHSAHGANNKEFILRNGNLTVAMSNPLDGLPYGHYARLILFWLTREACQRNKDLNLDVARIIPLGGSAHRILREIGILKPAQKACRDQYTALTRQLERLMHTTINIRYTHDHGHTTRSTIVAEKSYFWWEADNKTCELTNDSHVVLTREFFTELVEHAVPLSPIHISQLHRSPLALDLYSWAAHRKHTHKGYTRVTWEQIKGQLGTNYPDTEQGMRNFKKKARLAINKINQTWKTSGITEWSGGLILEGKETPITPRFPTPHQKPKF